MSLWKAYKNSMMLVHLQFSVANEPACKHLLGSKFK